MGRRIRPRHLLTVWNPSYSDDPLAQHLKILNEMWEKYERPEQSDPDRKNVYVWWAKIRSKNRKAGDLPHHKTILGLGHQATTTETHLYLTDYRSLYVAHVDRITTDNVRTSPDEIEHMPDYYRGHSVDYWFRIIDLRRLVTDDTLQVIAGLKELKNTRYGNRPVSLYGGMVELPLIVFSNPERRWFSDDLDDDYSPSRPESDFWAYHAALDLSNSERIAQDVQDNLLGRKLWLTLETETRAALASAEAVFRKNRDDPRFDLSGATISYVKAIETELNALLLPLIKLHLETRPSKERTLVVGAGQRVNFSGRVRPQMLFTLQNLLREPVAQAGLKGRLRGHDHHWLTKVLPGQLDPIRKLRNRAAHNKPTSAAALELTRSKILGIGEEGIVARIAQITRI